MIQRIQSIFLALVAVLSIVLFFVPMYQYLVTPAPVVNAISTSSPYIATLVLSSIPLLLIVLACISILAIITIFGYKNRKRQIKMCRIGVILSLLISLDAMVFPQFFIHGIDKSVLQFGIGSYLLPLNIILFALAAFFIQKDENLVRAADRLR